MDRKGLRGGAEDIESAGEMVGRVHSIDSFTAVDGHGIRLIAFLQGCRKRCAFCCNVDSTNASASKGMVMTVDGVLSKLARNRKYYAASGGGLTLSGGECLLQPDFVKALATGSKALGLTTAIDTAAEGNETVWNEILPHVDIVLLCVKSTNRAKYHRITGTDADEYDTMRNFLRELDRRKIDTWLRFVLMTDDDERFQKYRTNDADELRDLAALAKSHDGCVRGVELLPYHRFGVYKFAELGLEYKLDGMKTPTIDEIQRAVDFLRAEGVTVVY
ncbi:Radical-activating enzyme, conserved site [Ostreococcus tauri]|uniref:Radical-activating enzyme, conserved site n=1 Tax=Ostreococcus tauri TaxID=70448 RepID=A0A090MC76_OSTTA|nr:Radical-activating enzyme, conserved site [Ostreococcus tauri]CEG01179.1 Radical-activating enzyme, conserved site [Ostreococcus tauri]|eukprot:XP_022840825.1 Radical-activating enzyme, conserved site [Ostreococcus tauri]